MKEEELEKAPLLEKELGEEAPLLETIAEESTKEVAKTGFSSIFKSLIPVAFAGLSAAITPAGAAGTMIAGAVLTAGVAACGYAGYKLYQKNKERKEGESFKEAVLKPVAKEVAGKVKSVAVQAASAVAKSGATVLLKSLVPIAFVALSAAITPVGAAGTMIAGAALAAGVGACGYVGYKLYQKNKERKEGESFKEKVFNPVAKEIVKKVKNLAIGATAGAVAGVAFKALSTVITPIGGAVVLAATGAALLGANVIRKKLKAKSNQKERTNNNALDLSKNKVNSVERETNLEKAAIRLDQVIDKAPDKSPSTNIQALKLANLVEERKNIPSQENNKSFTRG